MSDLSVRQATESNVQDVAAMHVRAWQWGYRGLMPDEFLDSLNVDRRASSWERLIQDATIPAPYVAFNGDDAVGLTHAQTSHDEDASENTGEVTSIYLLPEYVGQGIGYQLWCTALDQLRKSHHTTVTVWVLDTNERGRSFYERVGLELDGMSKSDSIGTYPIREVRYRGSIQH